MLLVTTSIGLSIDRKLGLPQKDQTEHLIAV